MIKLGSGKAVGEAIQRFSEDKGEYTKVFLLFGYLFCVVAASTLGRTVADALFLSRFDASHLSMMYLPQSAAMILAGLLFQKFSSKFRLDRLMFGMIPVISLLALASRVGVGFELGWVFPVIYVGYDVFNFLMIVCFWQFATSVMDQRKAKRMIGLVGSGGIVGGIASGFGLKLLVPFVGTANLIYFYAVLQLLGLLAVFCVLRRGVDPQEAFAGKPQVKKSSASNHSSGSLKTGLFHHVPHLKYAAIMSAALVLSLTLIDYQFKVILRGTLQNDALAGFMGNFYGYSGLIALFVQLFISGKIVTRFGVMTAILVFPIALLAGSAGVLLMPVLAMAVTVKGSDKVLGDTIYSSVSQLIMFPIAPEWRGRAKGFMDNIVRNGAKGAAAVGLIVLSPLLSVQQFSYLILALLCLGIAAAVKVKKAYLQTLLSTLEDRGDGLEEAELDLMDPASRQVLISALESHDRQQVLYALRILRGLDGFDLAPYIPKVLQHAADEVCVEALIYVEQTKPAGLEQELQLLLMTSSIQVNAKAIVALAAYAYEEHVDTITAYLEAAEVEIQAAAIAGLIKYYGIEGMFRAVGTLKQLIGSTDEKERKAMASLFGQMEIKGFYKPLIPLLKDTSEQVRIGALESAAILRVLELVPSIVPMLQDSQARRYAVEALASYDELEILHLLEPYLLEGDAALHLPQVFERIGTQRAMDLLLHHYRGSSLELRDKLLEALTRGRRKGSVRFDDKLTEELLFQEIELYQQFAEHAAALVGNTAYVEIMEVVQQVRASIVRRIFQLLSLAFEAKTIQAVYNGWSEGDVRQQANAAEVIDQLLQGGLRAELGKLMSSPREITSMGKRTESVDKPLLWLHEHGEEWLQQVIQFTVMQQRGSAVWEAIQHDSAATDILTYDRLAEQMLRIRLLRSVPLFQGLSSRDLSAIAQRLKKVSSEAGSTIVRELDSGDSLYVIHKGRAVVYRNQEQLSELGPDECFGQTVILTGRVRTVTVIAQEDMELYRLDSGTFYEMMFDRTGIAIEMMKLLSRRLRTILERAPMEAAQEELSPMLAGSSVEAAVTVEASNDSRIVSQQGLKDTSKHDVILRRVLVLQKIDLFSHLAQEDLVRLAQMVDEVQLDSGEVICNAGDFGDTLYGIIEGNVRVHRGSETIALLHEGEYFGEMAIIDSAPRSADCTAEGPTVLLQLHKDQVFSFCFQNMEVLRSMMRVLADRLKGML